MKAKLQIEPTGEDGHSDWVFSVDNKEWGAYAGGIALCSRVAELLCYDDWKDGDLIISSEEMEDSLKVESAGHEAYVFVGDLNDPSRLSSGHENVKRRFKEAGFKEAWIKVEPYIENE